MKHLEGYKVEIEMFLVEKWIVTPLKAGFLLQNVCNREKIEQ